jgi:hypothetical protein
VLTLNEPEQAARIVPDWIKKASGDDREELEAGKSGIAALTVILIMIL